MNLSRPAIHNIIIFASALILFTPLLGKVHLFDWDEANFAESAREMIVSGDYFRVQINFDIFWEKPPLFMWLQAISMHLFGINEYAARFPNAIAGLVTLLVIYNLGRKEFDRKFALLWVLAYAGSILPHFYFKSGIIDPVFNLFIFLSIWQLSRLTILEKDKTDRRLKRIFFAGIFAGLAVLTKGPVAVLILLLCAIAYMVLQKSAKIFFLKEILIFFTTIAVISFAWFGVGLIKDGPYFIVQFIEYQLRLFSTEDAGHGGPFFYHFVILLVGCFPASIYVFKSFNRQYSDTSSQRNIKRWMSISLFIVLILFSVVRTKIVHYSSFCYFPITFLAAYSLHKIMMHRTWFARAFNAWFLVIGGIISLFLIFVPVLMKFREYFLPRLEGNIKDEFALESLKAPVQWSGAEITIGAFYLAAIILAAFYHYRRPVTGAVILFVSTLITVQFTLYLIVPKVERHVQGAVIDFYKSVKGKDAYVESIGFKSYGDLFYAEKPQGLNRKSREDEWLLYGSIDKPAYLVRKINRNLDMERNEKLEKLGQEGGYVFYRRVPE
jgi:4-amino-4-deoxy-L-arabinose transferase-like glycosyltransferase